ncbi:hypothetical protein [Methylobacterium sp. A54F]
MLNSDPLLTRPTLTNTNLLAHALAHLRPRADSAREVWRLLTDNYVVDLDAVATLLPSAEEEPRWLAARG